MINSSAIKINRSSNLSSVSTERDRQHKILLVSAPTEVEWGHPHESQRPLMEWKQKFQGCQQAPTTDQMVSCFPYPGRQLFPEKFMCSRTPLERLPSGRSRRVLLYLLIGEKFVVGNFSLLLGAFQN